MSSTLSLSLFGLLVCAAICLANPVGRMEEATEVTEVTEVTDDTAHSQKTLDEIIADDYSIKQNNGIDEIVPDHEEPMTEAWEDHNENHDRILGDSEEHEKEEVVEEDADNEHIMVKRDVEEKEEEEEDVEVAEDEEHLEEEVEEEDEEEHEVEKRDVNEGLLEWYRAAIDTKST